MGKEITTSFVCVSRGRPAFLKESIESIYERARFPDKVELLLRFDEDDQPTLDFYEKDDIFKQYKNIRVFVGPRFGYYNLWISTKNLLALTIGDIIVANWCDDQLVAYDNYDDHLQRYKDKVAVMGPRKRLCRHTYTRKAYEKYPIIKENGGGKRPNIDEYIARVGIVEGIFINERRIYNKMNVKGDQTYREHAVKGQGWKLSDLSILNTPEKEITHVR